MNWTIGEAFYSYEVDEGNAGDSFLCTRHGWSQVQMSGLVKGINVARQNTGNRNSGRIRRVFQFLVCGKMNVGWKIIYDSQKNVDDFEIYEDR